MKQLTMKESAQLNELREKLENAALAFNSARSELEAFREDIHSRMQSYFDDRSEKWQESDAGSSYQEWLNAWEEECCDEVDEGSIIEYPTEPS